MITLNATIRTATGKKDSKKLRREGHIPAILYGKEIKSAPIFLDTKEFEKVYREAGESTLVSLHLKGADKDTAEDNSVLIRDAIEHPLTNSTLHVDFYQVPMDEEVTVAIPLIFENEAPAAQEEGAVLVRNVYALEVSALPKDLPHEIRVDLSRLEHMNDAILAKDIPLPSGVTMKAEDDFVIASVTAQEVEEVAAEPTATEVAPEKIKTEGEEKREEAAKEQAAEEASKA